MTVLAREPLKHLKIRKEVFYQPYYVLGAESLSGQLEAPSLGLASPRRPVGSGSRSQQAPSRTQSVASAPLLEGTGRIFLLAAVTLSANDTFLLRALPRGLRRVIAPVHMLFNLFPIPQAQSLAIMVPLCGSYRHVDPKVVQITAQCPSSRQNCSATSAFQFGCIGFGHLDKIKHFPAIKRQRLYTTGHKQSLGNHENIDYPGAVPRCSSGIKT